MKVPAVARRFARKSLGMARAPSITAEALHDLAAAEPVVVIGVGVLAAGTTDPRLPGEQRVASLLSLADVVSGLPRQQAIVLHCG